MTVGILAIGILATRTGRPATSGRWPLLVAIGLGDLVGNACFLFSNAQGALSVAVVLSSLYPVTTIVLAASCSTNDCVVAS